MAHARGLAIVANWNANSVPNLQWAADFVTYYDPQQWIPGTSIDDIDGDLAGAPLSLAELQGISKFSGIAGPAFNWEDFRCMKLYTPLGVVGYDRKIEENEVLWTIRSAKEGLIGVEGAWAVNNNAPSGHRVPISELIWQTWSIRCVDENIAVSRLQYIFLSHIKNEDTVPLIQEFAGRARKEFSRTSTDAEEMRAFYSLLASQLGLVVGRLVRDHGLDLGGKTVVRIGVDWHLDLGGDPYHQLHMELA